MLVTLSHNINYPMFLILISNYKLPKISGCYTNNKEISVCYQNRKKYLICKKKTTKCWLLKYNHQLFKKKGNKTGGLKDYINQILKFFTNTESYNSI